jgi:radical SAM protein with 4Fe4S-binding SPASM domain
VIQEGTYTQFAVEVHEDAFPLRVPVNVTIEMTNRCPLECLHCYNNLPMDDGTARRAELTTEEHKRVLDELSDIGCLWLLFTGGEVFARRDFFEIYRYAKSKGFLITIFTNGTLITERVADALAADPPLDIEITLYGATKETYDTLTGIPGAFERCMRGIDLLLERNLPLRLKTVATTINKHEVAAMKRFTADRGLHFKFDPLVNPRIDCSASPLAVRLTPQEIVAMDLDDPDRLSEWRALATLGPTLPEEGEVGLVYSCGGGLNSFALDPYGNMSICVLSHVDEYNIRDGSVREGWENFLHRVRNKPITRETKCTRCPLTSVCGTCAATAELEVGDPEAPVDFLCKTAHLRAELFGVRVYEHGDCEYCPGGANRDEIDAMAIEVRTNQTHLATAIAAAPVGVAPSGCGSGACGSCTMH